jgi:hypothetical protein
MPIRRKSRRRGAPNRKAIRLEKMANSTSTMLMKTAM